MKKPGNKGDEHADCRQIVEQVRHALAHGQQYDLRNLVTGIPAELKEDILRKSILLEIDFYRDKGWTYNLRRHEEFPELSQFISQAISSHERESSIDLLGENGPGQKHFAKCEYTAERWSFAEGGQGALYKATDAVLGDREVAIKVLKNVHDAHRFLQEAEVTARMDHPGIVAVYSYSADDHHDYKADQSADCRPFYAMRLVNGKPLQDCIADFHNRSVNKKIRLDHDPDFILLIESLISACHTIAYAHSVGVLHCDVKPQNIMCGDFGATIVLDWGSAVSAPQHDLRPKGIGKRIKCPDWTNDSQYTTAYASPEQKERNPTLDETTDVFSLGATLYQIITGNSPIDLNDYPERKDRDQIGSVRHKKPDCPRPLESICIKSLKRNPTDRYSGPEELADDLSCWLRGEEITAKPDNVFDKSFRFANRHRATTFAGLVAIGLLFFGIIGFNAIRFQKLKLEASLDSGFNLIEDICGPLENGELQNPKELETTALLVLEHCNQTIDNETSTVDDNLMLGRLYHLRSLTRFYYDNYYASDEGVETQSDSTEKANLLNLAIDDIDEAIRLFQTCDISKYNDYCNNVIKRLAGSSLFKARLHFQRDNRQVVTGEDEQIDAQSALSAIEMAEAYFLKLRSQDLENLQRFKMAESYQLKGEILLRKSIQSITTDDAKENYDQSASAFMKCNAILEGMKLNLPREQQKQLRALGRGYGYLGDVYRDQAMYAKAFESFEKSVGYRKQVFERDKSFENQRQLSRGYANFAWTLRNLGVVPQTVSPNGDDGARDLIQVLDLDELESKDRQQRITNTLKIYMGTFDKTEPGSDLRALSLLYLLYELEERSSRREVGTGLCLMGELYLHAATQTDPVDSEILNKAREYIQGADEILREFYKQNSDDRGTKTGWAYCLTMLRQVYRLDPGSHEEPSLAKILDLLPKVTDQNVTNDELFLRCVAFASGGDEFTDELNNGLRKLARSGFQYEWRLKQFFNDEQLKVFEAEKNAPIEPNE